jgi:hypothetical protein
MHTDFDLDDNVADGEFVMTRDQLTWARKLQKLLDAMPAGIELLVGSGHAHIHPEGWYNREIWDAGMDMMRAGDVIDRDAAYMIVFSESRIRPNSETI